MSSKITSFTRVQTHGVSNPLSGATVPVSNDHTDGSWDITDIYDRELLINTGNGSLQYRAGSDIYTVSSSPSPIAINNVTYQIGAWNMSTASAINVIVINTPELVGKNVTSINCVIYTDAGTNIYNYDYVATINLLPLSLLWETGTPAIRVLIPTGTGLTNFFRASADLGGNFIGAGNRGYVTVTYID